jgi:serine/threonine-protein kinase
VNAADGTQRWSETYDRELKDIFGVQEEIAHEVADHLRLTLLGERVRNAVAQPSNQSLDAYNAYLQGDSFFAQFNPESTNRAVEFFKEAIRLDPRYPKAHAALAWAYCRLGFFSGAKGRQAFTDARAAAERALSFNSNLSLARSALAYVQMNLDWDLVAAEAELAHADRIAPRDATVKNTLANLRSYQRRREEALQLRRDAISFDPLNVTIQVNLASDLIVLLRLDEGEAVARKALELQPGASQAHAQIARAHLERKDFDAALAEAKLEPSSMHRLTMIAMAETARGDTAAAEQATQDLIRAHAEDNPWRIAVVYAYRDDAERTFEWLDRAVTAHDPRIINTVTNPDLERYHSDPRFIAICKRAGLALPPAAR